jgi:uncharacterized surface protein with fasciclin (FAS1) repeats
MRSLQQFPQSTLPQPGRKSPFSRSSRRWGSLVMTLALSAGLLTGCNDDEDSPMAPVTPPPKTIAEIAAADTSFSTLVTALSAAKLVETLKGAGPFTVFAPKNAAFAALPAGTLQALLADPEGDLKKILLYHVVSGSVKAEAVVKLTKAATVNGKDITIEVKDGSVILNGKVKVIATDIAASNGIIHVIDAVLLPPADPVMPKTIAEIAAADTSFSTLVTALSAAKLVETLKGAGPFTVFAPKNAAFAALPAGTLQALLADPEGNLKKILLYHVVSGSVKAEAVVKLTKAATVNGKDITIEVKDGSVILNGKVKVIATDIAASNGIIHVIDAVLLPPADPVMPKTIAEVAAADTSFSTLVTALSAAKLVETLKGAGPFTVFAPKNAAFAALPAGTVEALLADPEGDLKKILLYHVVSGSVKAEAVVKLTKAATVNGKDVTIEVKDGSVILNGKVKVIATDIEASNGIIHVIDAVLLPPADPVMPKTIAEIAAADTSFSTLVTALSAAKLVETLKGAGPFTVFAPKNAAFAALPAGTVEALLADPEGDLKKILLYHVVSGSVKAEAVVKLTKAATVNGKDITIEVKDGSVILNGKVKVIATDIEASNGVIHVIDGVLLP